MNLKRIWRSLRLCLITSGGKRAEYLRKNKVFAAMGKDCIYMGRKVPLYPNLIRLGENVVMGPNVLFTTHDATHRVLNKMNHGAFAEQYGTQGKPFPEKIGCISVGDNVFISANTTILYNVKIGSNVIIGAGSVVTKDIPDNSVAVGVPARVISDFDTYVKRRMAEETYDPAIAPAKQTIGPELEAYCWRRFEEQRK